jgi:gamma-glutamyl-gamma-aminobutyrate hydrolase PuuD
LYSAVYYDDCHPFNLLLDDPKNVDVVKDPDELKEHDAALIVWGGADIDPDLYRHPMHRTTHPGGMRDRVEWSLMQRAIERGIPIIGVCRGAQMLCAAAGGFLLQDVQSHIGRHPVLTKDNRTLLVNSIHHQMMAGLEKVDHEMVAWRNGTHGAPYGYMDNQTYTPPEGWREPEFVYFKKIKGYAIQWHPEMMSAESDATVYVLNYIKNKENERNTRNSSISHANA